MAGKKAALVTTLVSTVRKIDALNTPKRIGMLIAAFVVVVGLLEVAALQLGHVEVPLLGNEGAGTAVGR
ncbi:hypothetical protein [Actinomadura rudentiformis]|uniref:Uncharacterized protein n=1 Tax=Actinomadura rudentiformis TaxID=359158 RepID=A0A6H9Z5K8_9ACTN|nr:hypothetical protein [Actinomadura rudentiformis]KAB2351399.1 hypothetical protein F8566_03850 [Actinomadura rudentiformis]